MASRRARSSETVEDALLLRFREAAAEVGFEFLDQQGHAFFAAAAMADGILDGFFQHGAVVELDAKRIGDRALFGVVIVGGEARLFDAFDFGAEGVDAGIGLRRRLRSRRR